jgi:Tol biopolymer transport system component
MILINKTRVFLFAAAISLAGCADGSSGFTGQNTAPQGGGAVGGGGGGGGGGGNEPLLVYLPLAGTSVFGTAIAGNGSRALVVSDEDPLGLNPQRGEQIFSLGIGIGDIVQLTNDPETAFLGFENFDITDNGGEVAFVSSEDYEAGVNPGNSSNLFLAASDGSAIRQVTRNTGGTTGSPQVSGDGALLMFTSRDDLVLGSNPNNSLHIFTINADGTGVAQVTLGAVFPSEVVMSDDGSRIAYRATSDPFGANADGTREIFVIGTDGLGHAQITMSAGQSQTPKLSDDGTRVAFVSDGEVIVGGNPDGGYEMYVANTDGTGITQITNSEQESGVFDNRSPGSFDISGNGTYVVFSSFADLVGLNAGLTHTLFWARADGGEVGQPLRDGTITAGIFSRSGSSPHMTDDGSSILFDSRVNYSFDSTGNEEKVFTTARQ